MVDDIPSALSVSFPSERAHVSAKTQNLPGPDSRRPFRLRIAEVAARTEATPTVETQSATCFESELLLLSGR